jgi:hypothetical protein
MLGGTQGEAEMENTYIVDGSSVEISALRNDVAAGVVRQYGVERRYAVALNVMFGTFDWFKVEASDKSEQAKPVHAEKGELYKALKEAKHTNPSTVWARIRKLANEERHGKAEDAKGDADSKEAAGDTGASHERSPMLRNIEELTALYKYNIRKDAEIPAQVRSAQVHIAKALEALGVKLETLTH